jgi:N-acetyl sugar amidotransferase
MDEKIYRICQKCIMDTSDPDIEFDDHGICNHCLQVEKALECYPFNLSSEDKKKELDRMVQKIKEAGKNSAYDCIIGVSGGVDSTYVAYLVKKMGLRPLAVHLDNGWNLELATHNIEKLCKKLAIDLYTHVLNWEEFRDLQISFLKASTPDSEIPTDHALQGLFYRQAAKHRIKYMIIGCNFKSESILPPAWSHGHYDWKYIASIHKSFGKIPLKTFPGLSYSKWFYFKILRGITFFPLLNYIDYNKTEAMAFLEKELGWQYYGGKHHESLYTKFIQSYILPVKFGYDKRKAHLSSLINSGQLSREEALAEMNKELYPAEELARDRSYALKKLGLTNNEFEKIMSLPKKCFWDYPSYEKSWYYNLAKKSAQILSGFSR